jgi:hypothetical protein
MIGRLVDNELEICSWGGGGGLKQMQKSQKSQFWSFKNTKQALFLNVIPKYKEFEVETAVNLRMITSFWPTV